MAKLIKGRSDEVPVSFYRNSFFKKRPIVNHAIMVVIPFVLVGMLVTNYLQAGLGKIVIGIVVFLSFFLSFLLTYLPFGIMEVYTDRNAGQGKDYFSTFRVTK